MAHIDVYISKDFSIVEKQAIIEAITQWQKSTDGLLSFHIVDLNTEHLVPDEIGNALYNITIIKDNDSGTLKRLEEEADAHGRVLGYAFWFFNCNFAGLCTKRIKNKKTLKMIAMHEIGHLLRLSHIDKKAVMHRYVTNMTAKISKYDLNQLITVWKDFYLQQ